MNADETRVYTFTGKVAHLLPEGDSANLRLRALCGFSPAWHYDWHGTGSQVEYERAAVLPTCKNCLRFLAEFEAQERRLAEVADNSMSPPAGWRKAVTR